MRLLFIVASFVSATLLFLVQPMVAKMILPMAGGTPAVWATCMVFFQVMLLAGYLYAHLATTQLGPRGLAAIHPLALALPLVMLVAAAIFLGSPLSPIKALAPGDTRYPFFPLVGLLGALVAVPFFFVATSAPLLQRWFADTPDSAANDPYFLYAASNLGSFVGLIIYPLYIERVFTLKQQAWIWAGGFLAWVAIITLCAKTLRKSEPPQQRRSSAIADAPVRWIDRLRWVGLAAIPSSLMLSVTTYATTDLAPIPLFFIVPLGIYLITFVIAFGTWGKYLFRLSSLLLPIWLLVVIFLRASYVKNVDEGTVTWVVQESNLISALHKSEYVGRSVGNLLWWHIGYHVLVFGLVALGCHLELARTRPAPRRLTEYYLWVSLGGVIGGLFNALIGPTYFKDHYEYAIGLLAACYLVTPGDAKKHAPTAWVLDLIIPAILGIGMFFTLKYFDQSTSYPPMKWLYDWLNSQEKVYWWDRLHTILCYGVPALIAFIFVERPLRFGLCVTAIYLASAAIQYDRTARPLFADRSFFGTLKVFDADEGDIKYHRLEHGSTLHGKQAVNPPSDEPLTYYHKSGPIGDIFANTPAGQSNQPLAFIGLGSGTISSYVKPGQSATFYEIDSLVRRIAEDSNLFSYVTNARNRGGKIDIVMGDARLKLELAQGHGYAFIAIDAFSSDSIPVHLLTKEAVQLYMSKLAPDGVLAIHVSNRYLSLDRVVARIAEELNLVAYEWWDNDKSLPGKDRSHWIALATDVKALGKLPEIMASENKPRWKPLKVEADNPAPLWTDDFSNVLSVFSW